MANPNLETPKAHVGDKEFPCNICGDLTPFKTIGDIYYCHPHSPSGYISVIVPDRKKK